MDRSKLIQTISEHIKKYDCIYFGNLINEIDKKSTNEYLLLHFLYYYFTFAGYNVDRGTVNKLVLRKNDEYVARIDYDYEIYWYTTISNEDASVGLWPGLVHDNLGFYLPKLDENFLKYLRNDYSLLEISTKYVVENGGKFSKEKLNTLNKDIRKLLEKGASSPQIGIKKCYQDLIKN